MTGLKELDILDSKRHNPAVGNCYGSTSLGRLLVVGMSHYGDEEEVRLPEFTHKVVNAVIGGKKIAYFTKIASLFTNEQGATYLPTEFYSSIAFYNFLPNVFKTRERVDETQWRNSDAHKFFFRVIDTLNPERVLVTGEKLWGALPSKDLEDSGRSRDTGDLTGPGVLFRCEEPKCCWYRVKFADYCLVGAITHPSTAKFNKSRYEIAEWVRCFMTCKREVPVYEAV